MPWVSAVVLLPALGALLVAARPRSAVWARAVAALASLGTLGLSLAVLGMFDRDRADMQMVDHQAWAERLGMAWDVGVDGISIWLVLLTTVLFALAVLAAVARPPERAPGFLGLLLLAEAGLLGLFTAGDLVLFYVFWEAMLIPFYLLIAMWGGAERRRATLTFVIYTMVGSLIMLVGIVATAFVARDITGDFTFSIAELQGVAFSSTQSGLLFAAFALAFVIKLPLWPFHAWMPLAYAQSPIIVTGLLAAVMSKAGVYGFMRIGLPVFPEGADAFVVPLAALALIGIVYGALVAWRAPTMRLLVAYSSLSHLGFILLGIIAFDLTAGQGAVLQMVNHGLVTAAAFAIVGVISARTGRENVDDLSGMAAGAPRLAGVFLIVAMAALAVPGSNAFVGEFFILAGVFEHHAWMAVLACIGITYAAVYMLRMYQTTMNGPPTVDGSRAELRGTDMIVLAPVTALMLLIALWPASIVGATRGAVSKAIAPAQVAADRPDEEIAFPVQVNPPRDHLPLPGDPAEGGAPAAGGTATP